MRKYFKYWLVVFVAVVLAAPVLVQPTVSAADLAADAQCQETANAKCVTCKPTANVTADCKDKAADPTMDCTAETCDIIDKYLNPFITALTVMVGIAVVIGIMIGGIQYASSGGDPQKSASGKNHIRNSIIALIAYFFLYAFLQFLIPGNGLLGV